MHLPNEPINFDVRTHRSSAVLVTELYGKIFSNVSNVVLISAFHCRLQFFSFGACVRVCAVILADRSK